MPSLRKLLLSAFALALLWPSSAWADWLDDVEIRVEDLGGGVYVLFGSGGNIGVSVGDDGVFMIDDQYAPLSDRILAALATITDQPVKFIINTHWHGDHTGGNEAIGGSGALIVAHDNVRTRIMAGLEADAFGRKTEPKPEASLPVLTFSKDTTFHLNGGEIHVVHVVPSHTDGDSVVHFPAANIVHMGDTFFHTWYPYVDYVSGGRLEGMIDVQTEVLGQVDEETKIIPGHGPMATVADLRASRDALIAIRDILVPLAASNKSGEEIVASKPLAPLDLGWGGFLNEERFVQVAIAGLRVD